MRKLLAIVIAAAVLWTGYWWVGAWAIERAIGQVFETQAAQGLVATNAGVEVHGIPNRWDVKVSKIALADPAAGWGWGTPFAQVYAMTWQPWYLLAALPSDQVFLVGSQTVTVQSDPITASLRLHPNLNLGLNEIVVEATSVILTSDAGWSFGFEKAIASTREDVSRANTHRIGLQVTNITPDAGVTQALSSTDLPPVVAEVYLDAHLSLSAPIDRHAGETQPQLTGLDLTSARVTWGALAFTASGSLKPGQDGLAEGEIAMKVAGWRRLPPILVALGFVAPDIAPTIENAMQAMAAQSPDIEVLDMVLRCKDGWMYLGPLPLGPAPKFNVPQAAG